MPDRKKGRTLVRELKSLEGSTTQPWNRRVLGDAIAYIEATLKSDVENGWDALAKVNAAKAVGELGPVGPVGPVCPGARGITAEEARKAMDEVEQAYHHGYPIQYMDVDDPLSGWHDATDTLAKQGFMWDDFDYRVKPQ